MRNKREATLHLTGGLGNQLFQFAAGLYLRPDLLKYEPSLGKPRLNSHGLPELYSFEHPRIGSLKSEKTKYNFFVAKVTGYLLRSGVAPTKFENSWLVNKLLLLIARIVLSVWQKKCVAVLRGNGVGYSDLALRHKHTYLVGYFQCRNFVEAVQAEMNLISIPNPGPELMALRQLESSEHPLIVHFRFGDYLDEPDFGIPTSSYYKKGIKELWDLGRFNKIWVFSDNISLAQEKFPSEYVSHTRWINDVDSSAAATMEAMRLGHAYVIANSTFSWWGAFLSYVKSPKVIAPYPWFLRMDSPKNLIPEHWIQRPS
jgi:hypothetical protein